MGISIEKGLYLLFDRLGESLVTPKGSDATVFRLNKDYLLDEFKSYGIEVNRRYCDKTEKVISLEPLKKIPDLSFARDFTRDQEFSIFIPAHRKMADELINVLLDVPENDLQDFLSICAYAREMLNCQLFFYCYSVALMHRQDTKNIIIPNLAEVFPAKLMDYVIFAQARESAAVCAKGGACIPVVIPKNFTATDKDIEHRVAYFREDIGVNLHHRYWHVVYPYSGRLDIVNKDRRGELFFYMHSQMLARYNAERLSNMLSRVKRFNNWDEPIPEAYFPKLDSLTASRGYAPRQANMYWQDVDRSNAKVSIAEMKRWRRNIENAIAMGMVRNKDGSTSRLTIDILGNMIEASILSPNPDFYGSLHNNGHLLTGYIHDPADRYLENFAVMADEATTMRDPFFYRWHMFIDDIFQKFKESPHVPPYTEYELSNPGVQIRGVRVENDYGDVNILKTFWMQSDVDIAGGLDFSERAAVYTRFTHLNYRPFKYIIDVNNKGEEKRATARVFMAPQYGEGGVPWGQYADQRKMFIEMDRFVVKLKPGDNHIVRLSTKSSVTTPFEKTFRNLTSPPDLSAAATNYCGCGWPQHMLVPRGTETGTKYDLFVMLSNYDMDKVDNPDGSTMTCEEASSFCGIKNKKYPDRRDMGFPFDRPTVGVSNVKDLNLPNMSLIDVTIRLEDVIELNPLNPNF